LFHYPVKVEDPEKVRCSYDYAVGLIARRLRRWDASTHRDAGGETANTHKAATGTFTADEIRQRYTVAFAGSGEAVGEMVLTKNPAPA
jgi:hypothetical protein